MCGTCKFNFLLTFYYACNYFKTNFRFFPLGIVCIWVLHFFTLPANVKRETFQKTREITKTRLKTRPFLFEGEL